MRTVALAFMISSLNRDGKRWQSKIGYIKKKIKTEKGKKLFGFFFDWFRCFDNFAFSSTFCDGTKLCCRHVCSTSKGEVAFAALPDANAFTFHFHEAALRALVGNFESSGDFHVPFADCCTVSYS